MLNIPNKSEPKRKNGEKTIPKHTEPSAGVGLKNILNIRAYFSTVLKLIAVLKPKTV